MPQAITYSSEREEMFLEHLKERDRRRRAEEKAERKRKMAAFTDLMREMPAIKVGLPLKPIAFSGNQGLER